MYGILDICLKPAIHILECEIRRIDPSPALFDKLLKVVNGVGIGLGIGHILESIPVVHHGIDAQAEQPVFGQVHVGQLKAVEFVVGVQHGPEVDLLDDGEVSGPAAVDQGLVFVGRPGPRQHVQEAEAALEVLVDEVGHVVLVALCVADLEQAEQVLGAPVVGVAHPQQALVGPVAAGGPVVLQLRLHLRGVGLLHGLGRVLRQPLLCELLGAHEPPAAADVLVAAQGPVVVHQPERVRPGPRVDQHAVPRLHILAEPLEIPHVRTQLLPVQVLEAEEGVQELIRDGLDLGLVVALQHQRNVFVDRGRHSPVLYHLLPLLGLVIAVGLVFQQPHPLLKIILAVTIALLKLFEQPHRILHPPLGLISIQFVDAVLEDDNRDIDAIQIPKVAVNALERALEQFPPFVVHGHTDQHIYHSAAVLCSQAVQKAVSFLYKGEVILCFEVAWGQVDSLPASWRVFCHY